MPGTRLEPDRLGPAFDALCARGAGSWVGAAVLDVATDAGGVLVDRRDEGVASLSVAAAIHGALVRA